ALSPDAHTLASADERGTILLWELRTGKSRGVPDGVGVVSALAVTDGGKRVAASGVKGVAVWDEGRRILIEEHGGRGVAISLSRAGLQLATATAQGRIRIRTGVAFDRASELSWKPLPNVPPKGGEKEVPWGVGAGWPRHDIKEVAHVHEFTQGVSRLVFSPDG